MKSSYRKCVPLKRERGECCSHPAVAPVSLCKRYSVCVVSTHLTGASGGQNLAALRTAAGQDLTAIGSRHSLTETMHLGTMTTAGLVGTLHLHYTSCQKSIMLNSRKRPQQHKIMTITVMLNHYNRKKPFGQPLFRFFGRIIVNCPLSIVNSFFFSPAPVPASSSDCAYG